MVNCNFLHLFSTILWKFRKGINQGNQSGGLIFSVCFIFHQKSATYALCLTFTVCLIYVWLIYDWYMIYAWYMIDIWLIYAWYMLDIHCMLDIWLIYVWYMLDIHCMLHIPSEECNLYFLLARLVFNSRNNSPFPGNDPREWRGQWGEKKKIQKEEKEKIKEE